MYLRGVAEKRALKAFMGVYNVLGSGIEYEKFQVSGEKMEIFSSKFNVNYIEMIPVQFSSTLVFSYGKFKFLRFSRNC